MGVAVVAIGAFGMASIAGARALNAIAAPALVVLIGAALQVSRIDTPAVEYESPQAGFPGEFRTIRLDVAGSGVALITDSVPDELTVDLPTIRTTLPDTISYELALTERGEWTIGPPTVVVTDVLGLMTRRMTPDGTTTLLVYPELYDLQEHEAFAGFFEPTSVPDRQTFDGLREYAPGDPLRDVHWKSSAKQGRDDLVVREFVGQTTKGTVSIAATARAGHGDEMASATASIALLALDSGYSVSVSCPTGELPAGHGDTHRQHVLELLARTTDGHVDESTREHADILVTADSDGISVRINGRQHMLGFEEMQSTTVAADGGHQR